MPGIGLGNTRALLDEEPGWTYGYLAPSALNEATGERSWAIPGAVREVGQGLLGLFDAYVQGQQGQGLAPADVTAGVAAMPGATVAARAPAGALGATMLRREAPPLDMSRAARMRRASEQGYRIPAYHSTEYDFPSFRQSEHGDFGIHVGSPQAANDRIMGYWKRMDRYYRNELDDALAKGDHDKAGRMREQLLANDLWFFDSREGANVMPLMVRAENPLDLPDTGRWVPMNVRMGLFDEGLGWIGDPKHWDDPDSTRSPEKVWSLKPGITMPEPMRVELARWLHQNAYNDREWRTWFPDLLRRYGYDSVRYVNDVEDPGSTSYLLLEPSQVRSRFAKFDPARQGDPDLLAGRGLGLGVPGSSEDAFPQLRDRL